MWPFVVIFSSRESPAGRSPEGTKRWWWSAEYKALFAFAVQSRDDSAYRYIYWYTIPPFVDGLLFIYLVLCSLSCPRFFNIAAEINHNFKVSALSLHMMEMHNNAVAYVTRDYFDICNALCVVILIIRENLCVQAN